MFTNHLILGAMRALLMQPAAQEYFGLDPNSPHKKLGKMTYFIKVKASEEITRGYSLKDLEKFMKDPKNVDFGVAEKPGTQGAPRMGGPMPAAEKSPPPPLPLQPGKGMTLMGDPKNPASLKWFENQVNSAKAGTRKERKWLIWTDIFTNPTFTKGYEFDYKMFYDYTMKNTGLHDTITKVLLLRDFYYDIVTMLSLL